MLWLCDWCSEVCSSDVCLYYVCSKKETTANGYEIEQKFYRTKSCKDCPHREKCYKGQQDYKTIKASFNFLEKRKQSLSNITSGKGINLRINRSIQVEGAFGIIKQDMNFRRFLTRGKHKTETQFFLLALAFNILKLCSSIQNGRFNIDLFSSKNTA